MKTSKASVMSSRALHIVRAGLDTADEIGLVHAVSWKAAYRDILPAPCLAGFTPEKRAEIFRRNLIRREKNDEEFYLFRFEEKAVGMAILGNAEEPDIPAAAGEIGAFYFLPDIWGTGLAQEAMTYCLSRFQERGSTRVILWVLAENRRARRFYEKNGFRFDGGRHAFSPFPPSFPPRESKETEETENVLLELRYSTYKEVR